MKKLLATLIAGLAMVLVPAGGALAWHAGLTGSGACQDDGSFKITWKVDNSSEDVALKITYSSNTAVVPLNTIIPKDSYKTFTQTVSGTQTASYSLTLKGAWYDKWGHAYDYWYPSKATVSLKEACEQPHGTITVSKQTVPAGDSTDFTITASTDNGSISGQASQSIKDGGSVVYTVGLGTYSVDEAAVDGWTMTSNTCKDLVVSLDHLNVTCAIVNTKNQTPVTPPVTPPTGGKGGGQVLAATTTTPQVVAPVGAVNGGEGGASKATNFVALLGLTGSLGAVGYGVRRLVKSRL